MLQENRARVAQTIRLLNIRKSRRLIKDRLINIRLKREFALRDAAAAALKEQEYEQERTRQLHQVRRFLKFPETEEEKLVTFDKNENNQDYWAKYSLRHLDPAFTADDLLAMVAAGTTGEYGNCIVSEWLHARFSMVFRLNELAENGYVHLGMKDKYLPEKINFWFDPAIVDMSQGSLISYRYKPKEDKAKEKKSIETTVRSDPQLSSLLQRFCNFLKG